MSEKFICSSCGEEHGGWPAIGYHSPDYYLDLSDEEKSSCKRSDDVCIITSEEDTFYFIRAVLYQKVKDCDEYLDYGLWVSLSEKSFNDYYDNYDNKEHEAKYFGWLANDLPDYNNADGIPTDVVLSKGGQRPEIFPHKSKEDDLKFIKDYYEGITMHEAQKRIDRLNK